jgi:hypothetical protein
MNPQNGQKVNWWFYVILFVIVAILIVLIVDKKGDRSGGISRSKYDRVISELRKESGDNTVVSPEEQERVMNELRSGSQAKPVSPQQQAEIINELRTN